MVNGEKAKRTAKDFLNMLMLLSTMVIKEMVRGMVKEFLNMRMALSTMVIGKKARRKA